MKKFKGSVIIKKTVKVVSEMFLDPNNLKHYQNGFKRKDLILGDIGQEDSVSRLYYKFGRKNVMLEETVLINKLPESLVLLYHSRDMDKMMKCSFVEVDEQTTRFEYEYEYIRVSWFLPRLTFILFPNSYKKRDDKWNRQFKEFVEKE